MKKYIPKYYPTRYEGFDSDEVSRIVNNIKKYQDYEELKKIILAALLVVGIFLFFIR